MALFKKKGTKPASHVKERVAKSIAQKLVNLQIKTAKYLQQWQARSSLRKRNITLAVFALVWLSYCTYLLIAAIVSWASM